MKKLKIGENLRGNIVFVFCPLIESQVQVHPINTADFGVVKYCMYA